jgi:hypothetical protein
VQEWLIRHSQIEGRLNYEYTAIVAHSVLSMACYDDPPQWKSNETLLGKQPFASTKRLSGSQILTWTMSFTRNFQSNMAG